MINQAITYFFACLFFAGSVLLPLGDFSLMQDIPTMYRNYSHITSQDELGVIDFIGDYLLHGKEIFGNNEHDKPQGINNRVQFMHQANPINIVFLSEHHSILNLYGAPIVYTKHGTFDLVTDFHNELFRPPLF